MAELDWLPAHAAGLSLEHNGHKNVYETIEQMDEGRKFDWVSQEEREKAIREDSLWVLHWYPDTPVGFYEIAASSLEALKAHFSTGNSDNG